MTRKRDLEKGEEAGTGETTMQVGGGGGGGGRGGGREEVEVVHTLREGVCGEFQMSAEDRSQRNGRMCASERYGRECIEKCLHPLGKSSARSGHLRARSLARSLACP